VEQMDAFIRVFLAATHLLMPGINGRSSVPA